MSTREFAAAFEAVVRYSASMPPDRTRLWAKSLLKARKGDDQQLKLLAMADDLEERGDWRHAIVRHSAARHQRSGPYAFDINSVYRDPGTEVEEPHTFVSPTFGDQLSGRVTVKHADDTHTVASFFPGHEAEVRWVWPHSLAFPSSRDDAAHQLRMRMPVEDFVTHVLPTLPDHHAAAIREVLKQTHPDLKV